MILIYEQDITHYRASFYDFLAKQLNEEILILYGEGEPNSYHIMMGKDEMRFFKSEKIKRYWFGRKFYIHHPFHMKKYVGLGVSCVIHRGAIRNAGLIREIKYYQKQGIPVVVRGQGYSRNREFNPDKNLVDRLHKKIVDTGDAYLCYTHGDKTVLDRYNVPDKIVVGINTLNTEILTDHYNTLQGFGKSATKEELGLPRKHYLCYIGRLSKRKKLDKLISSFEQSKRKHDLGLIIIGAGEYEQDLRKYIEDNHIDDVVFTGSLSPDSLETSKYIFSSDIVFIPGWLGLAVNHAFFLGKPIVGSIENEDLRNHGPEAEYVVHGFNGTISKSDDTDAFVQAIDTTFDNLETLGINALAYAQENLTVQKMAEGYIEAINKVRGDRM
jgi:glycosyltransferase involved in cell wall biosynthesis